MSSLSSSNVENLKCVRYWIHNGEQNNRALPDAVSYRQGWSRCWCLGGACVGKMETLLGQLVAWLTPLSPTWLTAQFESLKNMLGTCACVPQKEGEMEMELWCEHLPRGCFLILSLAGTCPIAKVKTEHSKGMFICAYEHTCIHCRGWEGKRRQDSRHKCLESQAENLGLYPMGDGKPLECLKQRRWFTSERSLKFVCVMWNLGDWWNQNTNLAILVIQARGERNVQSACLGWLDEKVEYSEVVPRFLFGWHRQVLVLFVEKELQKEKHGWEGDEFGLALVCLRLCSTKRWRSKVGVWMWRTEAQETETD